MHSAHQNQLLRQDSEDTSPGIVTSGALDFGEAAMVMSGGNGGPTKRWAELAELTFCPENFCKFKIGNGKIMGKNIPQNCGLQVNETCRKTIHSPVQGRKYTIFAPSTRYTFIHRCFHLWSYSIMDTSNRDKVDLTARFLRFTDLPRGFTYGK